MGMILYGHPSIYKLNSADKETDFQKKVFRMCSTGLLLWRNQKGSTRYPIISYKRDSTADIFLWIFKLFSDELLRKTVPNHWL